MDFQPFYRRPAFLTLVGLGAWIAVYIWAVGSSPATGAIDTAVPTVAADLVLAAAAMLLALAIVSQFVLPVRRAAERLSAFRRLLGYLFGERGPVMFIENGRAVEGHLDRRQGPGVLLIGQASAAVLRTDVAFTRAVGPGVVFTSPGERLAEALDLRRQHRRLSGPTDSASGLSSRALTRDGIPLAADLSVTFMLDPGHGGRPREGTHPSLSPYEFHPDAAARAVYGHAYDRAQDVPWTELAVRLVADAWREQVRTRTLDEFLGEGAAPASTLGDIRWAVAQQLAPSRDSRTPFPTGSSGGREAEILKSRGIRVLDVHITNLRFPTEVQAERIRQWQLRWEADREPGLSQARELEQAASRQGTREADRALAEGLTAGLREALASNGAPDIASTAGMVAADSVRIAEGKESLAGLETLAPHLRAVVRELKGEPSGGGADA